MTAKKKEKPPRPEPHAIVVVAQHSWGKGATVREALTNCRKHFGPGLRHYLVFFVAAPLAGVYVNGMGMVCWEHAWAERDRVVTEIDRRPRKRT